MVAREEAKQKILDFVATHKAVQITTIIDALKLPGTRGLVITLLADGKLNADMNWHLSIGDGIPVD